MKKVVSATEARVHFGEVLRSVAEDGATFVVEKSGRPYAIVIAAGEYDRLMAASHPVDWWEEIKRSQAMFQEAFRGTEVPDPIELIKAGREERDDAILGNLLRREPGDSSADGA